jgi:hypothetical protein
MAISNPVSDLARSIQHEQSFAWPESVKIQLLWRDKLGRPTIRSEVITSDQFFGHAAYGAPLSGEALIQTIERMRRQGPPKVSRGTRASKA